MSPLGGWRCPVCGGADGEPRFAVPPGATEGGVDAVAFRPSASAFGHTAAAVVRCRACGHGSLEHPPDPRSVADAYADASDEVSLREEAGQVATADRDLARIERHVEPGAIADVGCWTGSFLAAATARGWRAVHGVEPSQWAVARARERGLDVRAGDLFDNDLPLAGGYDLVVMTDVIEHLDDPAKGLDAAAALLSPGGHVFLTLPDAGSALARLTGRRWWSVLPMHLQYFTRSSLVRLLDACGFGVVSMATHSKVFSVRYYAERFGGYSAGLERLAVGAVERLGVADRLVAPDLRDRMAVLARLG